MQENTTHKRAKRQSLSQLVATRLQWTDKKAWQKEYINDKYYKYDPQKKHGLRTVSKKLLEGLN